MRIRDVFWLGPPAPEVLGSDSKIHLESRCCAILIYDVCVTGVSATVFSRAQRACGAVFMLAMYTSMPYLQI